MANSVTVTSNESFLCYSFYSQWTTSNKADFVVGVLTEQFNIPDYYIFILGMKLAG